MTTKSCKPTLLCVDDNQTALYVRKLVLESAGYSVLIATDFATAIGLFSSSAVDLVLTDHVMEDGSGTELAAAMKRSRPDVPIAIISGLVEAPEGTPAKSAVPVHKVSARNLDVQDAIGSCAYRLYEQRGREHGHDLDDWLRAEGDVFTRMGT